MSVWAGNDSGDHGVCRLVTVIIYKYEQSMVLV